MLNEVLKMCNDNIKTTRNKSQKIWWLCITNFYVTGFLNQWLNQWAPGYYHWVLFTFIIVIIIIHFYC